MATIETSRKYAGGISRFRAAHSSSTEGMARIFASVASGEQQSRLLNIAERARQEKRARIRIKKGVNRYIQSALRAIHRNGPFAG